MRIDLDHNATTPLDPRVREVIVRALDLAGNPSSVHDAGRRARDVVEKARREVAALAGVDPGEVVFTSSGTEADWLGVVGLARAARKAGRPARVVTSPLEHPAVRGAVALLADEGFEVVTVQVGAGGRIDPDEVARALDGGAALAAFALANHELGNLTDVVAIARVAHAAGALVHCDAVQAAGKVPLGGIAAAVDAVAISAHKLHGPKGAGALIVRRGIDVAPLLPGHQERGRRGGTENVAGIAGFGAAARLAREASWAPVAALRDRLEAACIALGARIHGTPGARVANTTNVAFAGVPGDLLVAALDLEGVAASTGAACTSGSVEPSPVIRALGVEAPGEAVRFSLGLRTTTEEIDRVISLLPRLVDRIRASG